MSSKVMLLLAGLSLTGCGACVYLGFTYKEKELFIAAPVWDAGKKRQGDVVDVRFEMVNNYDKPIEIVQVVSFCDCAEVRLSKNKLEEGDSATLQTNWKLGRKRGQTETQIGLRYRDPDGNVQTRALLLKANVVPDVTWEPSTISFHKDISETKTLHLARSQSVGESLLDVVSAHPALKVLQGSRPNEFLIQFDAVIWRKYQTIAYINILAPTTIEPRIEVPVFVIQDKVTESLD